jgi:endoglucanase
VSRTGGRAAAGLIVGALLAGCTNPEPVPGAPAHSPPPSSSPPSPGPVSAPPATIAPATTAPARTGPADTGRITAVRVLRNRFVDAGNRPIRLLGANYAGGEYACVEGDGYFDTPDGATPGQAVVDQMRAWHITAVRIPLNEQCWLGLPAVSARYAGDGYRSAVRTFVDRLNDAGIVAILDLHRSAPAGARSDEQEQMPDRDHSPDFWRSVAAMFADRPAVVFDLFNEPFPYAETGSRRAWACWRDGGCTLTSVNSGEPYVAAGMNELIAAVRSTGARNVVLAGGIHWAEAMTRWLAYRPTDPLRQLAASFHAYSFNTYCARTACYDRDLARLAKAVPLFTGEIGPTLTRGSEGIDENCPRSAIQPGGFAGTTLDWLDEHGASWTAWSWNPWPDCWALTSGTAGEPTPEWGREIRRRLAAAR